MNRQVDHLKVALIAAGLISGASSFSSSAMQFGELSLHSYLGQPLRASIPLKANPDEEMDSRCFSLGHPANQSEYASYLTQARLELVESGGQFQLLIRSAQAINEPFLRLLVQSNCGQGLLSRKFTLLLDPVEYSQTLPSAVKPAAAEPPISEAQEQLVWEARQGETLRSIAASLYPRQARMQRNLMRVIREANPELRDTPEDTPLPEGGVIHVPALRPVASKPVPSVGAVSKPRRAPAAAKKPVADPAVQVPPALPAAQEGGFRLKLSTADLDMSMLGKMTEAQRQQLREKQLLLDADDQVANFLSMKNRIRQLEEQIDSMQKALEKTNSRIQLSETLTSSPVQKMTPPPPLDASASGTSWLENTSFRGMAGVGLILALIFSVWWRWHRRKAEAQLESELEHEFADSEMPQIEPFSPLRPEQSRVSAAHPGIAEPEDEFLSSVTSIFDNEGESVTFTEAESVLDEADLYLAYGWANRAVELLQEYLEKHQDDIHLWKKLFEIYASQGMKQEFEQLALRCQSTVEDSGLWVLVQKLGRQLDAENPLYLSGPDEREGGAQEPAVEAAAEQDEVPTLDTPLDFVLDREQLDEEPEGDKASKPLDLDPLFPGVFENTQAFPEHGNDEKKPS
ncbi:MAG: hypothetical protein Q7U63_11455 [Polaromonas sp.]|uniref:type IV pilus assembly protein FimV n=1 Tax=Polaromonas sp. TaxID=1869339 RepID=UPI00272347DF|nr:hypothetical protein [Polaromonas sp.]MDO9114397.1 hypothetical protein [Polaromonas sp.]MDP1705645.1 hypothetical protein [Sulfurimicrobium sp.]MDP2197556.1 hypothetical protein [Sulfurimicrobium sp.]MDP3687352.1 hypothetical protein [Sulfurimicrobium sp.]